MASQDSNPPTGNKPASVSEIGTGEPKTVSLEQAKRVEPTVVSPDTLALRELEINHTQTTQQNEQGIIGKFLGSKTEKPGNVAFIAILFSFLFVLISYAKIDFTVVAQAEFFHKTLTIFISVITLALGYLFGSSDRK